MNNNYTEALIGTSYLAPKCKTYIIQTEGPLCASLQQLSEDGDYSWGNEEN